MGKKRKGKKHYQPHKKSFKADKNIVKTLQRNILGLLAQRKSALSSIKIEAAVCKTKAERKNYSTALLELISNKSLKSVKGGYILNEKTGVFTAKISRICGSFGFAQSDGEDTEIFIPGKMLHGTLAGDKVILKKIPSRTDAPEAEVIGILEEGDSVVSGTIVKDNGRNKILCSSISSTPLEICEKSGCDFNIGDKVLAKIIYRGEKHSEHKADVFYDYGPADHAENCAKAYIDSEEIPVDFPEEVEHEAIKIEDKGISEGDFNNRKDIRNIPLFTIDSEYSKDLDDAVSISEDEDGFNLGVHIADVSHYVKNGTPLDREAATRGTSIYYADKVIPMLPVELSNGICSLNPDAPRLALSCFMKIDKKGNLVKYDFKKTVIHSRVKGVYSEVNKILDHTADEKILEKYKEVSESIFIFDKLCSLRQALRKKRGAPNIESSEISFLIEDGKCVDVKPRTTGRSEKIIEEMMILANESAARFAKDKNLPFVYRVHSAPSDEKAEGLKEALENLGILSGQFPEKIIPSYLADILEKNKDKTFYPVLNNIVLRSMSKAQYSEIEIGHFGLALENYAHFTSPIRRYADLAVHRIISSYLAGECDEKRLKKLDGFSKYAAKTATLTEVRAVSLERKCEDFYSAEYMTNHIGEEYEGLISGISNRGVYVTIPCGIEGLAKIESFPEGEYDIDDIYMMREMHSGKTYTVGDKINVICARSDVPSGLIDFSYVNK